MKTHRVQGQPQPQSSRPAMDHLAYASTSQQGTTSPPASTPGQGTSNLHQIIDRNPSREPLTEQPLQTPQSNARGQTYHSSIQSGNSKEQTSDFTRNTTRLQDHNYSSLYEASPSSNFTPQLQENTIPQIRPNQCRGSSQTIANSASRPSSRTANGGVTRTPHQSTSASSSIHLSTDTANANSHQQPSFPKLSPTSMDQNQHGGNQSSHSLTIIDPSQVFNHDQYVLQQAKARADASDAKRHLMLGGQGGLTAAHSQDGGDARKEQIEADMKAMIRKMQEYKSRDPGLFSQVWEQVKTGQTPAKASPQVKPTQAESIPSPLIQQAAQALQTESSARAIAPIQGEQTSLAPPPPSRAKSKKVTSIFEDHRPVKKIKTQKAAMEHTQPHISPFKVMRMDVPPEQPEDLDPSTKQDKPAAMESNTNGQMRSEPARTNRHHCGSPDDGHFNPSVNPVQWANGHQGHQIAHVLFQYVIGKTKNGSKDITVEEISRMLEGNPTFPSLCDVLDHRGFSIDRPEFAKYLLAAVTEIPNNVIRQSCQVNSSSLNMAHSQQAAASVVNGTASASMHGHPHFPQGYSLAGYSHFSDSSSNPASVSTMQHIISRGKPKPKLRGMRDDTGKMVKPFFKTFSKADLAKKQSFSDIVDLTAISDNEEELQMARAKVQQEAEQLAKQHQAEDNGMLPFMTKGEAASIVPLTVFKPGSDARLKSADVVDQIQRQNALQRSAYNPSTIARDILLATGKHPSMAPLNEHLAHLRSNFRNVDFTSDLSSFNWDIIDPGGPDPNDADDEEDDPSQTVPETLQAQPLGSGQGPGVENGMMPTPAPHQDRKAKSMCAEFVQHQPGPGSLAPNEESHFSHPNTADTPLPISVITKPTSTSVDFSSMDAGEAGSQGGLQGASPRLNLGSGNTSISRRGRPPGSVNRKKEERQKASPAHTSAQHLNNVLSETRRSTPQSTPHPSNLRNEVTPVSPSLAVIIPPPSVDRNLYEPKRQQGRPRKSSPASHQQSIPKYPTYDCHWKDCPAKLHNLDTLKRHVMRHAKEYELGPFLCLWEGCVSAVSEDSSEKQSPRFKTLDQWENHMSSSHLYSVAKRFGDGPRVTPTSDNSDHYLSDTQGRMITPLAEPRRGRPDPVSLSAPSKTTKAYHVAHENNMEEERASAIYQAHLDRRRVVGPGVLRAGVSFVNEKKRKLLEVDESTASLKDSGSADTI